jgi:hypothetical protein
MAILGRSPSRRVRTMPKALDAAVRLTLFHLSDAGLSPGQVAQRLGVAESSVRRLLAARSRGQEQALRPRYAACGAHHRAEKPWHAAALGLRQQNPRWGAKRLLLEWPRLLPGHPRPSPSALLRLFRRQRVSPAPAGRRGREDAGRSQVPHDVWQVDAVEQEALADGSQVSWLRVADEATGAALATDVFAIGHFNQVPLGRVQASFRAAFGRWGLPRVIQVDNGSPWGGGDLPTPLALWLEGLGVSVRHTPPRRPQRNGVVERSHQTAQRWADPAGCADAQELQRRVLREDQVQREEYPHQGKRTRMQAYPGLAHSGRAYDEASERQRHWSWPRALERLGQSAVVRKVDGSGKIGLWGGKAYLGKALAGREVLVQFDAQAEQWVVADEKGAHLCRLPLTQVSEEALLTLPPTPPAPGERFLRAAKLSGAIPPPN